MSADIWEAALYTDQSEFNITAMLNSDWSKYGADFQISADAQDGYYCMLLLYVSYYCMFLLGDIASFMT